MYTYVLVTVVRLSLNNLLTYTRQTPLHVETSLVGMCYLSNLIT